MARHAGFASVASFSAEAANQAIAAALSQVPGQALSLQVSVGGQAISIQGEVWPSAFVTLRQRSDGLVTVTAGVIGQAAFSGGPLPAQYVEFSLNAVMDVPLAVVIANGVVAANVDISQITILQLDAGFSGGPPIVSSPPAATFQNALASPAVAAQVTSLLRQLSPLTLSLPLISASLERSVSVGPPPPPLVAYVPYPDYFSLEASVSRVVLAQFDGAMTIAVDLTAAPPGELNAPITSGDPAQLVDLTTAFSPLVVYWQLDDPQYAQYNTGATLAGPPAAAVNCVGLVNPAVVSYLMANQVSPGMNAAPLIAWRLRVTSIALDIGWYVPPVPYSPGYGLAVTVDISAYSQDLPNLTGYVYPDPDGVAVHAATVAAYLQEAIFELAQGAESTNTWTLQLVNASVDVPAWLVVTIVITLVLLAGISPAMLAISLVIGLALDIALDDLFDTLTAILTAGDSSTATQLSQALQQLNIPFANTGVSLGAGISADITTWKLGFSDEGAEAQLAISSYAARPAAGPVPWGVSFSFGSIEPSEPGGSSFQIYYTQATIDVQATVLPGAANPLITWTMTRPDTGAVVAMQTARYLAPGGGSLSFNRTGQAAEADQLDLSVQVIGPGGAASYSFTFQVTDWLDRRHKYLRWVSHTWFRDPAKPRIWRYYWQRTRPSVIHRTDYPGRCRRLNPAPAVLDMWRQIYPGIQAGSLAQAPGHDPPSPLAEYKNIANLVPEAWQYLDALPFTTAAQAEAGRRGVLCDYCFFGGPTKTQLLVPVP
jgi:hypothetical protein